MIILDTCIIIWDALTPKEISSKAKKAINENKDELAISSISLWEISMLNSLGRLKLECGVEEFLDTLLAAKKYKVCEITPKIAVQSVSWGEDINKDPADRIISATSYCFNWDLVTADKNLRKSKNINTIW